MKKQANIIIIGAGAAGLIAAKELSTAGYKITILEAQEKAGGRMCTSTQNKFGMPVEPGAEFIHGNLKLTLQLLKEVNIKYTAINGKMVHFTNEKIKRHDDLDKHWDELMERIEELKEDMTVEDFLNKYFSDEKYGQLRQSVQGFANGFALADTAKAAITPLKNEWVHEEEDQYRVDGGYIKLTEYLIDTCLKNKVDIHYDCFVETIQWRNNDVTITTADKRKFTANKIIITASAGMLQSGKINFIPALPAYLNAANEIGFGSVIKILLQFKGQFWNKKSKGAGFILSDETIPTWWTQLPVKNALLTGWLGGPKAYAHKNTSSAEVIQLSLQSLASIFDYTVDELQENLLHAEVYNWSNDKYSLGGYSYNTLRSPYAKQVLNTPVENTIYFSGEATYGGDSQATVEAALQSGMYVANIIIAEK
jgi:monoamine oxidase